MGKGESSMEANATKQRVVDALNIVIEEIPPDKLSVGIVSYEAGVSRQTFYYHFRNIYDVLIWAIKSRMRYPDGLTSGTMAPSPFECVKDLCNALKLNRELVYAYLGPYRNRMRNDLRDYLFNVCRQSLIYALGDLVEENYIDTLAYFHADGYIGLVNHWLEGGMKGDMSKELDGITGFCDACLVPEIKERIAMNGFKPR